MKEVINDRVLLYKDDEKPQAVNLLITSHGAYDTQSVLFSKLPLLRARCPPYTTLHFYNPHGTILSDPNIFNIMMGFCPIYEACLPGEVYINYRLSSFSEGRHNYDNDDYIEDAIKTAREGQEAGHPYRHFDVLALNKGTTLHLFDLLNLLEANKRFYQRIHCIFCRSMSSDAPLYHARYKRRH